MRLAFSQQAGDAVSYLDLGSACAGDWARCWDPLRPVGAILYFSLPYRLKLPPESIIILNWLLLLGSIGLAYYTMQRVEPEKRWLRWLRLAAISIAHFAFFWSSSWNSLSDLPATIFALAGMQFILLARLKDRWWCYWAIGLSFGISLSLRAFFLYPALLAVVVLLALSIGNWRCLLRKCPALVILLPIVFQYGLTYQRTQLFGFIYPPSELAARKVHFQSTDAGYDTSMSGAMYHTAKECFRNSRNFKDALDRRDISALSCILARRQAFYFGSYTFGGKIYLSTPAERHDSLLYLVASSLVMIVAFARLGLRHRRPESLLVGFFIVMVWGQSMVIRPEARYLYIVMVWMWSDALSAMVTFAGSGWLMQRWRNWRNQPADPKQAASPTA